MKITNNFQTPVLSLLYLNSKNRKDGKACTVKCSSVYVHNLNYMPEKCLHDQVKMKAMISNLYKAMPAC